MTNGMIGSDIKRNFPNGKQKYNINCNPEFHRFASMHSRKWTNYTRWIYNVNLDDDFTFHSTFESKCECRGRVCWGFSCSLIVILFEIYVFGLNTWIWIAVTSHSISNPWYGELYSHEFAFFLKSNTQRWSASELTQSVCHRNQINSSWQQIKLDVHTLSITLCLFLSISYSLHSVYTWDAMQNEAIHSGPFFLIWNLFEWKPSNPS